MKKRIIKVFTVFVLLMFGYFVYKNIYSPKSVEEIIRELSKASVSLGYENAMKELTEESVIQSNGNTFYRLQQNYNGIPVYGKTVVYVGGEKGETLAVTGNIVDISSDVSLEPTIKQGSVEDVVYKYIKNELRNTEIEELSISDTDKLQLCIFIDEKDETHLAYTVQTIFRSKENVGIYEILVDAHTGEMLFANSLLDREQMNGKLQGQSKNYQNITYEYADGEFQLLNSRYKIDASVVDTKEIFHWWHSMGDYKKIKVAIGNNATDFSKEIVTWGDAQEPDKIAVDAYVNTQITYEYFKEVLNVKSTDGMGNASIHVVAGMDYVKDENGEVGYTTYRGNAYSYSFHGKEPYTTLVFGVGSDGKESLASSLDTVAHEYMHGITRLHANLDDSDEASAINEALSDIFGELVENWHDQKEIPESEMNWIHGNRNMANPEAKNYPTKKSDKNNSGEDFAHGYSTVISHAAYLMWAGMDGDSEKRIDAENLASLWFQTMLMMPQDCDFEMCRKLVELVARNMKLTDEQVECIEEAFDTVGIYSQEFSYHISPNTELLVLGQNGELYDDYTVYVRKIGIDNSSTLFVENEIDVNTLIAEHDKKYCVSANAPYKIKLKSGTYKIALVDNKNSEKNMIRTVWVNEGGTDSLTFQSNFGDMQMSVEETRISKIEQKTGLHCVWYISGDFNEDGEEETYAMVCESDSKYPDGELWYFTKSKEKCLFLLYEKEVKLFCDVVKYIPDWLVAKLIDSVNHIDEMLSEVM